MDLGIFVAIVLAIQAVLWWSLDAVVRVCAWIETFEEPTEEDQRWMQ